MGDKSPKSKNKDKNQKAAKASATEKAKLKSIADKQAPHAAPPKKKKK